MHTPYDEDDAQAINDARRAHRQAEDDLARAQIAEAQAQHRLNTLVRDLYEHFRGLPYGAGEPDSGHPDSPPSNGRHRGLAGG